MPTSFENSDAADALKRELWAVCDSLPQRGAIDSREAGEWIEYMAHVRPKEAMWHMRRASGIGGSEIGGLVRNRWNIRADFEFSAHDWALGKLLKKLPDEGNESTYRGTVMEPVIRQMFYAQCSAERLPGEFERLKNSVGGLKWMRYSPDELCRIKHPVPMVVGGERYQLYGRYLADYKAPSLVEASDDISFQYAAQLNQGAILCEEQGIEVDGLLLVQFDYQNCALHLNALPVDRELCESIREAGDHYWGEVMQGRIPRYVVKEQRTITDDLRKAALPLVQRLALLSGVAKRASDEADAVRQSLNGLLDLSNNRLGTERLSFPELMSCSATQVIDDERLREHLPPEVIAECQVPGKAKAKSELDPDAVARVLEAAGIDLNSVMRRKLDPAKVHQVLSEHNVDPSLVITEKPVWRSATGVAQRVGDWLEDLDWFRDQARPDQPEFLPEPLEGSEPPPPILRPVDRDAG
ncbi:YqaJ viral recombinase family protein [Achromobacter sp.]|uniref:YqaJ viral recombinase family protein n=1 Tax=Achromobacter sp. TaxID=134375 RepID=UPI00257FFE81|nr:YqaJ viral recombinase family protein [Achromobacter sp.]